MSRHTWGTQSRAAVECLGVSPAAATAPRRLRLRRAVTADDALDARLGQPDDRAPADAQHVGRFVGEHLQLAIACRCRGDVIDQLELAMASSRPVCGRMLSTWTPLRFSAAVISMSGIAPGGRSTTRSSIA